MWLLGFLSIFLPLSINPTLDKDFYYVHIVDYANPIPLKEIINRYSAYDLTDGDITKSLRFETSYDENTCKIGYYDIIISVTNSNLYETKRIDKIFVKDFIAPVIELKENEIILDIDDDINIETILPYLTIIDNLDHSFEKIYMEGLEDIKAPGTYTLPIYVFDSSLNKSNVVMLTLQVVQKVHTKLLNDSIFLENNSMTKEDILLWFLAHEEINLQGKAYSIESNYFHNLNKSGIYQVNLKITNEDNTYQIYMTKINVTNKEVSEKEENTFVYISFFCIIGLFILGIFIYRKRC